MNIIEAIKKSKYVLHETKRKVLKRYILVLFIFIAYFVFISMKYGIEQGFLVSILTWTVFVFSTPIADAGFLVDFPIRVLTKIRMIYSEIAVWVIASMINIYALVFNPTIYFKSKLLKIFHYILMHPYPYWSIIILSSIGTFISIYFGDELIDVVKNTKREKYFLHRKKHILIISLTLFVIAISLYYILIKQIGIEL